MKRQILYIHIPFCCWGTMLLIFLTLKGYTQTNTPNLSVLKMVGDANHFSHFDTNIRLKTMLLDPGNPGQGTIELWAKFQNDSQSLWLTNDAFNSSGFAIKMYQNKIIVEHEDNQNLQPIGTSTTPKVSTWQHFAFTFYKTGNPDTYSIDVYVNGSKVNTYRNINIPEDYDLYFTKGRSHDEIMLTEIKAWNLKRTTPQIRKNRFTSFCKYRGSALEDLINLGLVVNYSGNADIKPVNPYLKELTVLQWHNTIQKKSYPKHGNIVTGIKCNNGDKILANIDDKLGNPIDELDEIIVTTSKGEFTNKVDVSWFHIDNMTTYKIYRNNIEIGSMNNVSRVHGDLMIFSDEDALPGSMYRYKVKGVNSNGSQLKVGNDAGFIFPNGKISGNIKTQSNVFVKDVGVVIELENHAGVYGTALSFNASSDPVTFLESNTLTDQQEVTIEFWYRNQVRSSNYNSIFKLGDTEILIGSDAVILKYAGRQYRQAFDTKMTDTKWHHFAFSLGTSEVLLFKDEKLIGKSNTGFSWTNSSVDHKYYINHSAYSAYSLDEFRVWKGKRTLSDIQKYALYTVDSNAPDLLIAYNMDLPSSKEMYNHAFVTKGKQIGKCQGQLIYTSQNPMLKYITFTDANGNYEFSGMYSNATNGTPFTITAIKNNHNFRPSTVGATIKQSTLINDFSKVADFTDISELPISGRIVYIEDGIKYPVPAGKQIAIDGNPIVGATDELISDQEGAYSISSSLGLHEIKVFNPELSDDKSFKSLQFSPIETNNEISSGGYAVTKNPISDKNGVTLSAFVKPYLSVVTPSFVPVRQTLLSWGKIRIELHNNNVLQFYYDNLLKKETALTNPNSFTFFGLSVEPTGHYTFSVNENHSTGLLSSVQFTAEKLFAGATLNSDGIVEKTNLSNLGLIQFRNVAYDESQLNAIRQGAIIADDEEALILSYEFDQEKGTKALSKTKAGKFNYLLLMENAAVDASQIITYNRKYQFNYKAINTNYNPETDSDKYKLNVTNPLTEVDFEMTNRFGFIGNIVIPCDYNIGSWSGTIVRMDSQTPKFEKAINSSHFDTDNQLFYIDDLLAGKYQIYLTNTENPSIKLNSPILDITKSWGSYDFEYRAPLALDVKLFRVKEEKSDVPFSELTMQDYEELQKACENDFIVLDEGNPVLLQATIFEKYGDYQCVVSNAEVNFSGNLLRLPEDTPSISVTTDSNGHAVFTSMANVPNFIAPHTRTFSIKASHKNRILASNITGLIEGSRMNESDFTIADPIVNYVLHDPPGDGSSATLKKGTSSSTKGKWITSLGYSGGLNSKFGSSFEQDVVATVFGVGTSIKVLDAKVTTNNTSNLTFKGTYSGSNTTSFQINSDISTSSRDNLVGKEADLFIGTGYLITVGSGETLAYDSTNCSIAYHMSAPVVNNQIDNSFVHSYYDVKQNIIPNLLLSIKNEQDTKNIQSYKNSVIKWIENLVRNDMALNLYRKDDYRFMKNYSFLSSMYADLPNEFDHSRYHWDSYKTFKGIDKNRSFDGGSSSFSQRITTSNTLNNGGTFESSFKWEQKTKVENESTGVIAEFEYHNSVNTYLEGGFEITDQNETVMEYKLTDDDAGDRFAIEIKRDPNFAVPIFKTLAGQSFCPAERGTQIRSGVEIEADLTSGEGIIGEAINFKVKLRNTQMARNRDAPKIYRLAIDPTSNPHGAMLRVGGSYISYAGVELIFDEDPDSPTGIEQEKDVVVKLWAASGITDPSALYEDIRLIFKVPCEQHRDTGFKHNQDVYKEAGIKSADTLHLTARFYGSCIKNASMKSPKENWVINQKNKNIQDFVFTISGTEIVDNEVTFPESLTAVDIEYALAENNTPKVLKTIPVNELKTLYQDNAFRLQVDVSGLLDGSYGFRIVPVCGTGNESWRKSNPSPYAYGMISRTGPQLLVTNPVQAGTLSQGSITATFDSPLDPRTISTQNVALRGTLGGLPKTLTSVDFSDANDQIQIPHHEFLNLTEGYTIECWINPTNYPTQHSANIFSKGSHYSLKLDANGRLCYHDDPFRRMTTPPLPLQEWTHVALVYDGIHTLNIYFNGRLVHTNPDFIPFHSNTEDLFIGATSGMQNGFIGQLDELRIWSKARTHSELVSYNNKQLLGNEANLNAYFVFDNNGLIVDNHQEAVRDYTGHTKGSTQNGISWVTGDLAAPLLSEQLVQDIPISISTNIDQNEIIITPLNFQEYYLEGSQLTAILNNNSIRGIDGNPAKGHTWSFTINKNNVTWEKANTTISQHVGTSVGFDALLKNAGGADASFELQALPDWLRCSNVSVGSHEPLLAGFEKSLEFTTSAYLNQGTYYANIGVISYTKEGVQSGYEYFTVEVQVKCEAPDYAFNTSDYAFKKEFITQLSVHNEISQDPRDILVAYFNDEIRG